MEENIVVEAAAEPRVMRIGAEEKLLLAGSATWAKFIAIFSFVVYGLCIICMIFALIAMAFAGLSAYDMDPAMGAMSGMYGAMMWPIFVFCIAIYIVMLLPAFYLLRFAQRTRIAVDTNDQNAMAESLQHLRSYMKTTGIIYIASLAFGILAMIGGIIAGVLSVI